MVNVEDCNSAFFVIYEVGSQCPACSFPAWPAANVFFQLPMSRPVIILNHLDEAVLRFFFSFGPFVPWVNFLAFLIFPMDSYSDLVLYSDFATFTAGSGHIYGLDDQ